MSAIQSGVYCLVRDAKLRRTNSGEAVSGLLGTKVNFGAPDARDIENGWEPLYLAAGVQPKPKQEPGTRTGHSGDRIRT